MRYRDREARGNRNRLATQQVDQNSPQPSPVIPTDNEDQMPPISGGIDVSQQGLSGQVQPQQQTHEPFENIIDSFSEQELVDIGSECVRGYEKDLESRSDWEDKRANWAKLFLMVLDKKSHPWENSSNVCMPVLTTAILQFQARAFEALFTPKGLVHCLPINDSQKFNDMAKRVEKFMNYQTMFDMENYEEGFDTSLMAVAIDGTIFRKAYYNPVTKKNCVDYVPASEFVINYNSTSIEASERYTHRLKLTKNQIRERISAGMYTKSAEDLTGTPDSTSSKIIEQKNKSLGLTDTNLQDDTQPREILEQHCYLNITKDDYVKSPVIVTTDKITRKVLRITKRVNPITKERMDFFIPYTLIPNPYSIYGVGFGQLLEQINEQINTTINQLNDSGLLSNTVSGVVNKRSGMKRGDIKITNGVFSEVDLNTDDIRKAIMPYQFNQPSNVLFSLLGKMQEYSEKMTTVSEIMTGGMPSSDTPATTIMTLVEQGMKVFSAIHRRLHRSFKKELKILYDLNGLYLDLNKYFEVVINQDLLTDPQSGQQIDPNVIKLGIAKDFTSNIDVKPVSDPNIVSRVENMSKAQLLWQSVGQNPLIAQQPDKLMEAFKYYLQQMEVNEAMIEKICVIPPPQAPPDLPQEQENDMFFNGQNVHALQTQDHQDHLRVLTDLFNAPIYNDMNPDGKNLAKAHYDEHMGFVYLIGAIHKKQMQQQLMQQQQQLMMGQMGQQQPQMQQGGGNIPNELPPELVKSLGG